MSDTPFVSYAQNAEDVVLWRALGQVQEGRYVDLGGASVSLAFHERGWRGVVVESLQEQAELRRQERPNDHVRVPVALSDIDAEAGTLTRILDEVATDMDAIHFAVIGATEAESQTLGGLDLRKWRPWVLLVQATRPNSTEPSHQSWESYLSEAGYSFCLFDGLSRFYVAAEHREALEHSLSYPACVFDNYIPYQYEQLRQEVEQLRHDVEQVHDMERQIVRWRHRALIEWAEMAAAAADSDDLARKLTALQESLSWRVTEPLRSARRAIGRLR